MGITIYQTQVPPAMIESRVIAIFSLILWISEYIQFDF